MYYKSDIYSVKISDIKIKYIYRYVFFTKSQAAQFDEKSTTFCITDLQIK